MKDMKKYIFAIVAVLLLSTCSDYENPVGDRGTYVVPALVGPSPGYFTDNIESSYVQFSLSLSPGESVEKAAIEVVGKGKSGIVKEVSLPATDLRVTASEVLSALGLSGYDLGDAFFLYVLTTKNGVTTRSGAAFAIPVVCFFEPAMLVGTFDCESEEDWGEENGNPVTIVADPNDPYKVFIHGMAEVHGVASNGNGIELNMNPDNFNVSGPVCIWAASIWGYSNIRFQAVAGNFSACDQRFTITFRANVDQGGFGDYVWWFTRR